MIPEERLIHDDCQAAAADLSVRIVAPFTLAVEGASPVDFIALFPDFGGPKGTVVCRFRDWMTKNTIASRCGYYCSGLHPDSYTRYDRDEFVGAFEEWGWHGDLSERPQWCRAPG
jgi:hypothetical protein